MDQPPDATENTAQDAPGTIFSRGGSPLWYPPFSSTRILKGVFRVSTLLNMFERSKTMWTLSSLWTQRTRPQVTWKTAKTAVFHTVHIDHFFLAEERSTEERTT